RICFRQPTWAEDGGNHEPRTILRGGHLAGRGGSHCASQQPSRPVRRRADAIAFLPRRFDPLAVRKAVIEPLTGRPIPELPGFARVEPLGRWGTPRRAIPRCAGSSWWWPLSG